MVAALKPISVMNNFSTGTQNKTPCKNAATCNGKSRRPTPDDRGANWVTGVAVAFGMTTPGALGESLTPLQCHEPLHPLHTSGQRWPDTATVEQNVTSTVQNVTWISDPAAQRREGGRAVEEVRRLSAKALGTLTPTGDLRVRLPGLQG
ncbi:MAG TPA: hypothetical protein VFG33_20975 [Kribbella sp.]|uniref:hypothetical protein n=1 Tax=Kribbella sp. TaxID=1871183 RepID=UPI002D77F531|nr:hypothetical protein [Kribbella sp.]HET6295871.1 hypothetical protein [Kribbella sp.]